MGGVGVVSLPLSAVVGQSEAILALQLAAVDPSVGGVLLRGPRGTAKSTMARGLAAWLGGAPFVELPLGADEDKLVGTLDLQAALSEHAVVAQPGLLARAHGGVLYADEVNLLPDHLVDLLLDAAASGVVRVEREGVSQVHDAACVLVGTMNPDEGELRPQLVDRFGLCVDVLTPTDPAERSAVLQQRLLAGADAAAYAAEHQDAEHAAQERLAAARKRVFSIECHGVLDRIAGTCASFGVDGLRGDLAWLAAARAHAALHTRADVIDADLEATRDMALRHRLPDTPPEPPSPSRRPSDSDRSPRPERAGAVERDSVAQSQASPRALHLPGQGSRGGSKAAVSHVGGVRHTATGQSVAWARTVAASSGQPLSVAALQWRARWRREGGPWIVLLDCSASMLRGNALARTQGAVQELLRQAYLMRREVAVLRFSGDGVDTLHPLGRPPKQAAKLVEVVRGGGSTPLRAGLLAANRIAAQLGRRRDSAMLWLFTDGRVSTSDLPASVCPVTVVDTDTGRGGQANRLAQTLGGRCLPLNADGMRAA